MRTQVVQRLNLTVVKIGQCKQCLLLFIIQLHTKFCAYRSGMLNLLVHVGCSELQEMRLDCRLLKISRTALYYKNTMIL
jgi:hypothetical protein